MQNEFRLRNGNSLFLGKNEARYDKRTIHLANILRAEIPQRPIGKWSVRNLRAKNPAPMMWGNDQQGDCVEVAICNHQTYNELLEVNKVPLITTSTVLSLYHRIAGDNGTVYLDALKYWRTTGIKAACRTYKIHAFADIDWKTPESIKEAIYLLDGIQVGVLLTQAQVNQYENGLPWTIDATDMKIIGGHGIYLYGYNDQDKMYSCITWGRDQLVSEEFVTEFADEAYVVVDEKDSFKSVLNIPLLESYLQAVANK